MNKLKEKLKKLKMLMIENNIVSKSKEELNIELERLNIKNEMLINENNKYEKQINKIKKAKKMFSLYTGSYYLFMILIVTINLSAELFLNHVMYTIGFVLGLTILYLYASYDEVKTLSRNDIRFYKHMIKNNNKEVNENDIKIKQLDNELKMLIQRSYELRQSLDSICVTLDKVNNNDISLENEEKVLIKKL